MKGVRCGVTPIFGLPLPAEYPASALSGCDIRRIWTRFESKRVIWTTTSAPMTSADHGLILDAPDGIWSLHVLFEIGMVVGSLTFAVVSFRGWRRSAAALSRTRLSLEESQSPLMQREAEGDVWRKSAESALTGFSEAINRQFDAWQLARAERDVALLILTGTLCVFPAGSHAALGRHGAGTKAVRPTAPQPFAPVPDAGPMHRARR